MRRRSVALCVLVVAGIGWISGGVRLAHQAMEPPPFPYPPRIAVDKFQVLREHLPSRGVIGYRTVMQPSTYDRLMAEDPYRAQQLYVDALLAQHALAPLRLKWRDDLQWTVGNYLDEQAVPVLPEGIGVIEVLRPGNGLVVYRRL